LKFGHEISLHWLQLAFLSIADMVALSIAWLMADWLGTSVPSFHLIQHQNGQPALLLPILVATLGLLVASGTYRMADEGPVQLRRLAGALSLAQVVLLAAAFLYRPTLWISRSTFLYAWLLSILLVYVGRRCCFRATDVLRSRHSILRQKAFILGAVGELESIRSLVQNSSQYDLKGAAYVAVRENPTQWADVLQEIRQKSVTDVFVGSWPSIPDPISLFWELQSLGVRLRIVPVGFQLPQQRYELGTIRGTPTIVLGSHPVSRLQFWVKRGFDLSAASVIAIAISLPVLLISLLIKLDSPGPIFFRQTRVGLKGNEFKVWKFRTMVQNAGELQQSLEAHNEVKGGVMFKMKDDPRITKVGQFLRKYSLDELPQVLNVLRGEMSLVGPRPLPVRDIDMMPDYFKLRHEVLPGITGLWQVSGRSDTDSEKALQLDLIYIQNWSLSLDLNILLKTIKVVLLKEGAY
jgi:exopolysaccharide biosynthesis polyprenyl glycosylphosphotransferase